MIQFENVSKVFPNGFVGLEDISFTIEPQTLTYIIGESGAGKTTLLRLLIRELMPSEGEIYFGGEPLTRLSSRHIPHLRRRIGVVFQDYKLIPERTIRENIGLVLEIMGVPRSEQRKKTEDVLDVVGLGDKADLFPVQLSGGELQRVSIARALATTPEVLFADEPTGNLDPETSKGIADLLKKITDLGTTVIISTHDLVLLEDFPGRELHLRQGKLVRDTAADEKEDTKSTSKKKSTPKEAPAETAEEEEA
ncbi:ATP-binding cassette domain-containing protein [Candidatus Woesebacteria bacterium]|nr:ATP-binding cassette domain-containing protein [Candidatus Woesebacteria bacterium]MCD8507597.1 ATP-binding cassette domain-containing protein [Candidatus Woesebacteria bacterium]MCD8527440.1 ATP-binding cassette domain-containing protein [Candidatus Woesebacteria bacterium]MCD8546183.1 ATP-binding cassette domain-containing protein [Candidatus Woesebacteria bacterium]